MVGTKAGGLKAAASNKARHGENFYVNIGKKGGESGHTGGFFGDPERAKIAGAKGGAISSRSEDKPSLEERRKKWEEADDLGMSITEYERIYG